MSLHIRPFTPEDYPAIAEIATAVYPTYPETPEHLRESDENRDTTQIFGRLVAEEGGRVVATMGYDQTPRDTPRYWTWVYVHPEVQGRGIGQALYERLLQELERLEATALHTEVREGEERSIRFVESRGFTLTMREEESALDVATFDPAAWAAEIERAAAQGIVLKSYAELKAEARDLEKLQRRLFELHTTIDEDIPDIDEKVPPPFEEWCKRFSQSSFLPEAQIYALDGEQIVGGSLLWKRPADNDLDTGMTGVRREYRKRGIATALKVCALTWAKAYGAKTIRTTNEQNNAGMLGINYRLGFQPQPAWLYYMKRLRNESAEPPVTASG